MRSHILKLVIPTTWKKPADVDIFQIEYVLVKKNLFRNLNKFSCSLPGADSSHYHNCIKMCIKVYLTKLSRYETSTKSEKAERRKTPLRVLPFKGKRQP